MEDKYISNDKMAIRFLLALYLVSKYSAEKELPVIKKKTEIIINFTKIVAHKGLISHGLNLFTPNIDIDFCL